MRVLVHVVLLLAAAGIPLAAQSHGGDAIEVPMSVRAGRLVVPAYASDGTELSFLMSTAAAVTVLSESGAARSGGGAITLGDHPLNMQHSETLPDDRLTVDGMVMDGMIGINTLNEFDVLLDAPGGRMVMKPFGPRVEWPGTELSEPISLRVFHGAVISLDVEVAGTMYPAMLELGTPSLLVNQAVIDEAGVESGTVDMIRLGEAVFTDVPIELTDHPMLERWSPNGTGFVFVGTPIALECAISISWVHTELRTCRR